MKNGTLVFDIEPRDVSGMSMDTLTADLRMIADDSNVIALPSGYVNYVDSQVSQNETPAHLASVTELRERNRG